MVKNRLSELQANAKHVKQSDIDALEAGNAEEMKPLKDQSKALSASTNDFFEVMDDVTSNIDKLSANVVEIKKLQKRIHNAVAKNQADIDKLNDLQEQNKRLGLKVRTAIKDQQSKVEDKLSCPSKLLASLSPKKSKFTEKQKTELRMRQTQINAQSTRFFEIWNEYNENQVAYRDQTKKLLVKNIRIVGNTDLTNEQIETMIDEGKTSMFATEILDQERAARKQLTELEARHDEFIKVQTNQI